jgi:hypothetical protein
MIMKTTTALLAMLVALPLTLSAADPGKMMEAAQTEAAKEKKHLLMVITASKWHQGSQKFEKEVLQTEAFQKGIEKGFVKVVFDYPQKRSDAHTDLLEIQQKYRFRDMPSLILADPMGRPYAYTGAKSLDPAEFMKHFGELHKIGLERDRLFAEAGKAKGMERAKLLVKALETLPQNIIFEFYAPELTDIADSDKEGKTGYVARIEKAEALRQEQARYDMLFGNRDFDRIIKEAKAEGAKMKGEDAQRLKLYEIRALSEKHDFQQAIKEVEAMTQLDPESGFGKRSERYLAYIKNAEARHQRMQEAAKNPKKAGEKGPSRPIVSKPVAIVTDIEQLKKEAKQSEVDLANAIAHEEELKKANIGTAKKIADLEAELKKLRENDKKAAEAAKKATAEREKLARKAQAMKDVVENHEAMEKRKRDIAELEKKASGLKKQAEDLRKKAEAIKEGK